MDLFTLVGTISVKYTDAIRQLEEVTRTAQRTDNSFDDVTDSAGDTDDSIDDLGDTIDETKDSLGDMNDTIGDTDETLGDTTETTEEADEAIENAGESAENANGKFDKWGVILANLATNIIQNVIDKCTDLAKKVVDLGKDFTATMSEVQAISGASNEDLQMLEETARKFGATTTFSATEAAEALKYMSLAGWSAEESASALGGVLDLAQASGMGLAEASDMVTDYLSAFGKEASDSAYFADMLAYAQANSNTTAAMLGEAYKNCAANLNAAGQDMETVTSMLEAMANQGLKGSEAGTAVAATMRDITNHMFEIKDATELATYEQNGFVSSTGDLNDVLGKNAITVGNTIVPVADAAGNFRDLTEILKDVETATNGMGDSQKAAAMSSTFTVDSIKGMNLMMNEGMDAIAGYEEELRKCSGTATDMAKTMNDNLKGDLASMNSAWEELGLKVFNTIERPLRVMVQAVTGSLLPALTAVLQGRNGAENILSSALQTLVTKLGVHLNHIAGQLTNVISVIVSGILKSLPSLIPVVTKIFTTIADTLAQNTPMILGAISEFIQKFAERFASNLPVIIAVALNLINALAEGLLQAIPELLAILPDLVRNIADGILQSVDMIITAGITLFLSLVDAMPEIISGIVNVLPVLIEGIVGGLLERLPDLIQAGITLFLALVDALPEIIQAITNVIPDIITAVVSAILDNLPAIIDAGFQLFSALIGALPDIIATVAGVVPDIVNGIVGVLPEITGKFTEFLQNIGNLAPIIMGVVTAFMTFKGILGVMAGVQKATAFFSGIPALLAKAGGAVSKLFAVVAANPTVAIIAAIVGVIAVLVTLWNTNEDFRNAVLAIWDSIKTAVQNAWNFFVGYGEYLYDWLNGIVSAVSGFFSNIWNFFTGYGEYLYDWIHGIMDTTVSIFTAIKDFITGIFDAIYSTISTIINTIYTTIVDIWNAISDFISEVLNTISDIVSTVWNAILGFISGILNGIFAVVSNIWNGVSTAISNVLNTISTTVSTIWNNIKTAIENVMNTIKTTVSNIWDSVKTAISDKVTSIKDSIVNGFNTAVDFVKNLAGEAWQWGADIIDNIVTGIKEKINNVADAVTGVADTIREYLHFSVPDKGPLTDFESWMPDFMNGLANGINSSKNTIDTALNSVAESMQNRMLSMIVSMQNIWKQISNIFRTAMTAIYNFLDKIWNDIVRLTQGDMTAIQDIIKTILDAVRNVITTIINSIRNTVKTGFEDARNTISNIFDAILNSITSKMESAKNIVKNGIDKLKSFFNFTWSLPHLKLPHFSISGEFNLDPPSVPTFGIDWYAKGGIMTEPTVFGFNPSTGNAQVGGEAGAEAIAPIDMLLGYVRTAVQEENQALAEQVQSIISLLNAFFPILLQRIPKEVVLDTGAVVGELTPAINEELGNISDDDERRRL